VRVRPQPAAGLDLVATPEVFARAPSAADLGIGVRVGNSKRDGMPAVASGSPYASVSAWRSLAPHSGPEKRPSRLPKCPPSALFSIAGKPAARFSKRRRTHEQRSWHQRLDRYEAAHGPSHIPERATRLQSAVHDAVAMSGDQAAHAMPDQRHETSPKFRSAQATFDEAARNAAAWLSLPPVTVMKTLSETPGSSDEYQVTCLPQLGCHAPCLPKPFLAVSCPC
jgi:hypothetical protein